MSKSKSVVKNTGAMLLGTIIRMSASLVLVVFIGRKLGPKGMGEFSLILTLFWIFQTMAGMGIQPLLIREVAKDRGKTGLILVNATILTFLVSLLMAGCMIGFGHIMGYSAIVNSATLWMGLALVLATVSLVFQSVFIAWEKAELVLLGMTWENCVRLGTGIWVLVRGGDVVAIAAVFALASLVNLCVNIWLSCRRITCADLRFDWHICVWLARLVPAFAGISVFSTLFWNMDILLLSRMVTIEEVGYYGAPMRLVNVIKLILQSYKVAVQPVAARLFLESMEEFRTFCEKSLFYIFVFTIPVCIGGLILSDQVLPAVFGDAFAQSTLIFKIVIWMVIPYGILLVFATFLIASHNQNVDLRINIISMVLIYILGYGFISLYGGMGAGIAVLAAVTIFMAQQLVFIMRHLFKIDFWRLTNRILLSALVMGAAVYVLRGINVFINIGTGVIVYFGMLSVLRVFSFSDVRYLIRMKK
ncbi:flippase [bacterium]|nr:flippase [bacterium]